MGGILDGGGWDGIPNKFGRDCDDGDATEYPGVIWYADVDGDAYGNRSSSQSCQRANSTDVLNKKDCNDNDETVYPGAPKLCDGQVNDVDADAGTCSTALSVNDSDEVDDDGDGYVECAIDGDGWDGSDSSIQGDDCSDAVTTNYGKSQPDGFYIHPNAAESDTNSSNCMKDVDEDGYGDNDIGILAQELFLEQTAMIQMLQSILVLHGMQMSMVMDTVWLQAQALVLEQPKRRDQHTRL